jgi:hypothetical protein
MPFTSVLGASSVIKPGVCTSSTRPTAPYVGQLVFETDTNRLVVFTASGWVYQTATGAPGLVHITSASFTSATSVSLPANTFTSTQRNYKVIFVVNAQTGSVSLTMRLRAGGSDNTTSNYYQGSPGFDSNNSVKNTANNEASSLTIGTTYPSSTVAVGGSIVLDVLQPQVTEKTHLLGHVTFFTTSGHLETHAVGALHNTTTSFDSLSLISSVASSITGVVRVYGYGDS